MKNENSRLRLEALLAELAELKGECAFELVRDLGTDQLTMKQLAYLKVIDDLEATTISNLAEIMALKKPTVTETVHKLQKLDCIMKHQCTMDGRIYYITLTEKGEQLARLDQLSYRNLVDVIYQKLEAEEIKTLMILLEKLTK